LNGVKNFNLDGGLENEVSCLCGRLNFLLAAINKPLFEAQNCFALSLKILASLLQVALEHIEHPGLKNP